MGNTGKSKLVDALAFAAELGFLVAVPIGGFIFLGFLGDRFFETRPFFLIIGVVVGAIVSFYGAYHSLIPLMKDKEKDSNER